MKREKWNNYMQVKERLYYYIKYKENTYIGSCIYKDTSNEEILIKFINKNIIRWHNGNGGCALRDLPYGEDGYYWWFGPKYDALFMEIDDEEILDKIMVEIL